MSSAETHHDVLVDSQSTAETDNNGAITSPSTDKSTEHQSSSEQPESATPIFPNEILEMIALHSVEHYDVQLSSSPIDGKISAIQEILSDLRLVSRIFNDTLEPQVQTSYMKSVFILNEMDDAKVARWAQATKKTWVLNATEGMQVTLPAHPTEDGTDCACTHGSFYQICILDEQSDPASHALWSCFPNLEDIQADVFRKPNTGAAKHVGLNSEQRDVLEADLTRCLRQAHKDLRGWWKSMFDALPEDYEAWLALFMVINGGLMQIGMDLLMDEPEPEYTYWEDECGRTYIGEHREESGEESQTAD